MKFLIASDLHGDLQAAQYLVDRSPDVDCVLVAGDVGHFHRGLAEMVSVLQMMTVPCLLVPGNHETTAELRSACARWREASVLHGETVVIGDITCFGMGGGIPPTPFGDWSHDFSEAEARRLLANSPAGGIFLSHSPPKGAVDVSSRGISLGSQALRDAIEDKQPILVVCGHIHESSGQSVHIGKTTVVNAGPKYPSVCLLQRGVDGAWRLDWE